METPVLSDPKEYPSEEIIFSHIGKARPLWDQLFEHIHANHPDISEEWRYYRDGKSWLMKVTRKKKTIFWLSIVEGAFRTTFYFTDKAEELIMSSKLSDDLKEQFRAGKQYGKIKGITVVYSAKKHIEAAKILIEIKLQMK
jgi:hypothetical protein